MEMQRLQPVVVEDLIEKSEKGGTNPVVILLVKKGKNALPSGFGTPETTRSFVFPLSLLSPADSRRMAARFFYETLGESRAGSYQAFAADDTGDEAGLTLRGAMGC